MAVDPASLDDPVKLRVLMANARGHGREDIAFGCQTRIAELYGQQFEAGIEREFWIAVAVAEEIVTIKNKRTTKLSRARQKVTKVGVFKTVSDLASSTNVSEGFHILIGGGRPELTADAIVLRHRDKFDESTVSAATKKLLDANVSLDRLII